MLVYDNFLPDNIAQHLRISGVNAEYVDWSGPDGQVYKRICIVDDLFMREAIERIYGPVDMLGMAYRLNYEGEAPNQSIHSDIGWGTHAMVLYLADGPSGTAFWRHRKSGKESLPVGDILTYIAVKDDWEDDSKWEITNVVDMQFNRALFYESKMFHSRYPFEAFGSTPEDGRLILVAFFTPKEK